jgi:uncharacterized membrane protein YeaQ/YmgE (transglycosylase-associated protein family)
MVGKMQVSINFTLPEPAQLITYIVIGLLAALVVALLARLRTGIGFIIIALVGAIGAWVFASLLRIQVLGDIAVAGVPIIESLLGALLFAVVAALAFMRRVRAVA